MGEEREKLLIIEERLNRLIKEDNVDELSNILNSNDNFRITFNDFRAMGYPLLHFAVQEKSQKVVEYLLSQDFVNESIYNYNNENIYHVICRIRGAEELFSIIERKVPHHLLEYSPLRSNVFDIACEKNNIFIVKRVYEILETLQFDLTEMKKDALYFSIRFNNDVEVIKYVLSFGGIPLLDELFYAIEELNIEVVVHLLNIYLCQSIPSHLHNQFHIFQFSNLHSNYNLHHYYNNGIQQSNNDNNDIYNNDNNYYSIVTENYKKIIDFNLYGNKIWHGVSRNANLDVVQLIFSLKEIQPELSTKEGYNVFLLACETNSNIKVIKYIHKLFPSLINPQIRLNDILNGALLLCYNLELNRPSRLNILHYLYLNGIDIHFISTPDKNRNLNGKSIFSTIGSGIYYDEILRYLKVISQDFDYLHNEHDHEVYRKPSFWREIKDRNNIDEQSLGINEWKNRFEEHVLHHLSKMIQQHMLQPNQNLLNL